ncbi:MAG: macro domain-containing protein [Spirochaetota bacterium]
MPPVIRLVRGDITRLQVDAIVTAANSRLQGGGGVDAAVHKAAGPELLQACGDIFLEQGECPPGNAVLTPAYHLQVRFVIHAVGPIWPPDAAPDSEHDELNGLKEMLYMAYQNSLKLAAEKTCKSIAFPCISTGVYHFPKQIAARIALTAIKRFFQEHPQAKKIIEHIYLVCFDEENYLCYSSIFS